MSTSVAQNSKKTTSQQKDFQGSEVREKLNILESAGAKFCRIQWGEKRPQGMGWQKTPLRLDQLDLTRGGVGIIFGHGGLMALDIDNEAGRDRFTHYFQYTPAEYPSVSWASGKNFDGEYQPEVRENNNIQILFYLSEDQGSQLNGRKAFKENTLDIRWTGSQSVLPARSPHPGTGKPYFWHHAPGEYAIARMPDAIWGRMLSDLFEGAAPTQGTPAGVPCVHTEIEASPLIQWMQSHVFSRLGVGMWDCFDHNFSDRKGGGHWRGISHREGAKNPTSFMIAKSTPWIGHDFGDAKTWTIWRYYNFFKFGDATPPKGDRFIKICQILAAKALKEIPPYLLPDSDRWHQAWQKFNTFTPDEIIRGGYVSDCVLLPNVGEGVAIQGPMAAGKSTAIRKWDRELLTEKVDYPTYRNSLGRQQHTNPNRAQSTTACHIGDDEFKRLSESGFLDHLHGWGCIHSNHHRSDEFLADCNQIWDEVSGIIRSAIDDSNIRDFVIIWDVMIKALQQARRIVATDANMTDSVVDFLLKVSGKKIKKIKFVTDKKCLKKVHRLEYAFSFDDGDNLTINERDFSPLLTEMCQVAPLGSGQKLAISSDSQLHCKALDRRFSNLGYKVLRIDSETAGVPDAERFKSDPSWFEFSDFDILIFSPTLESGVDILCPFIAHYDFDFGVCGAGATKQRLGRCRNAQTRNIWQNPNPIRPDEPLTNSANVAKFFEKKESIIATWHDDPEISQFRYEIFQKYQPFIDFAYEYLAAKSWERWHPREALKELLEKDGIEIVDYSEFSEPEDRAALKACKEEIKDETAIAVMAARDITQSEADTLRMKNEGTLADQHALKKFSIVQSFPGISKSIAWNVPAIRLLLFKPRIRSQAKVSWLLSAPAEKFKILDRGEGRYALPWRWRSDVLTAKILSTAGISDLPEKFTSEDPAILAFLDRIKSQAPALGFQGLPKDRIKALNKILALAGLKAKPCERKRGGDGVDRIYSVQCLYPAEIFLALSEMAGFRFDASLEKALEKADAEKSDQNDHTPDVASDTPPIHFCGFYYKNQQSGSPAESPAPDLLRTQTGDPLVTPDGDLLTIGDRFEVVAGLYRGLTGYLEKTRSASDRVWLRFQDWKNTGFDCCKSVLISEIALAF